MPIQPSELLEESKCFTCFGLSLSDSLRLALLMRIYEGGGGGGNDLPSGSIIMWSGSIASIPSGWAFCDGSNGTPNLRNRFVVGASMDDGGVAVTTIDAGGGGIPSQSGGFVSHGHDISDPGHSHFALAPETNIGGGATPGVTDEWSTTTNTTGITVQPTTIVPPYYALAFIMKL
jgi:hypothetical protein